MHVATISIIYHYWITWETETWLDLKHESAHWDMYGVTAGLRRPPKLTNWFLSEKEWIVSRITKGGIFVLASILLIFRSFFFLFFFYLFFFYPPLRTTESGARRNERVKNIAEGHLNSAAIYCTCKQTSSWVVLCCVINNRHVIPKSMPEMRLSPIFLYNDAVSGPCSSVNIATDCGLDGPGSNPGRDEIFRPSRPVLGPTQPPVQWVQGLSRG